MNEIVKGLRESPNYNAGVGTDTLENEAADLIESLQAQLVKSKGAYDRLSAHFDVLEGDKAVAEKEVAQLQAQLIKAQSDLWRKMGECDGLREGADLLKEQLVTAQMHIDTLKSQLAASLCRYQAAVADLAILRQHIVESPYLLNLLAERDKEIERLTDLARQNYCKFVRQHEETERLREAQRWVPVGERLPGDGERVLVIQGGFQYRITSHYTNAFAGGWKDAASPDVTHWMPLPAAPEEGAEE